MEQMKTATVRDLRNRYTELLAWLAAGQEILITQRGKAIARLVPESQAKNRPVDWSQSPAVRRDRRKRPILDLEAKQSGGILQESASKW
jgi:prevent-host-death family protein